MFWDSANTFASPPKIDELLSKNDCTLAELLDSEDILQECRTPNKKLKLFLNRPETISELIGLIITEPPEDIPQATRFKHSNLACELLTSDLPFFNEVLASNQNLLQKLYSFLEQEPPLNPLLLSFFSKTFEALIQKKSEMNWFTYQSVCVQVLEFVKTRGNFLESIFKHIGTPVVLDLLFNLMTTVDDEGRSTLYKWLISQQVIEKLINLMGDSAESEKHVTVSQFLCDLIQNGRRSGEGYGKDHTVLDDLENVNTMSLLVSIMLNQNASDDSIVSSIKVILQLFDDQYLNDPSKDNMQSPEVMREHHQQNVQNWIGIIAPRVKNIHDLLIIPPVKSDIETTAAILSPPLGFTRLHVCHLLRILIETADPHIINAICEMQLFDTLLKLFKQYCWNNFLHIQISKCLCFAIQSFDHNEESKKIPSALQTHILVNCKLPSKLIDCWLYNKDSQSQPKGRRIGYMGHLIIMFDTLLQSIRQSDELCALVEQSLQPEERENWKLITEADVGEVIVQLEIQSRLLAKCDPHAAHDKNEFEYNNSLAKDFSTENFEIYSFDINFQNNSDDESLNTNQKDYSELFEEACNINFSAYPNDLGDILEFCPGGSNASNPCDDGDEIIDNDTKSASDNPMLNNIVELFNGKMSLGGYRNRMNVWSDENRDQNEDNFSAHNSILPIGAQFGDNPWDSQLVSDTAAAQNQHDTDSDANNAESGWADFSSNNFADFDAHFDEFQFSAAVAAAAASSTTNPSLGATGEIGGDLSDSIGLNRCNNPSIVGDNFWGTSNLTDFKISSDCSNWEDNFDANANAVLDMKNTTLPLDGEQLETNTIPTTSSSSSSSPIVLDAVKLPTLELNTSIAAKSCENTTAVSFTNGPSMVNEDNVEKTITENNVDVPASKPSSNTTDSATPVSATTTNETTSIDIATV